MNLEKKTSYVLMPRYEERDFDCWGVTLDNPTDLARARFRFRVSGGSITKPKDIVVRLQEVLPDLNDSLLKRLTAGETVINILAIFKNSGRVGVEEYLKNNKGEG